MKELQQIIAAYDQAVEQGKKTALATVVRVEGSAYRNEGARMLIREDGQLTGAISGGCLEGDALRRALHVMARQRPVVVVYDTTDDDHGIGLQLGCEGVVQVLIEPLGGLGKSTPINLLRTMVRSRKAYAVAVLFQVNQGAHFGTFGLFDAFGNNVWNG